MTDYSWGMHPHPPGVPYGFGGYGGEYPGMNGNISSGFGGPPIPPHQNFFHGTPNGGYHMQMGPPNDMSFPIGGSPRMNCPLLANQAAPPLPSGPPPVSSAPPPPANLKGKKNKKKRKQWRAQQNLSTSLLDVPDPASIPLPGSDVPAETFPSLEADEAHWKRAPLLPFPEQLGEKKPEDFTSMLDEGFKMCNTKEEADAFEEQVRVKYRLSGTLGSIAAQRKGLIGAKPIRFSLSGSLPGAGDSKPSTGFTMGPTPGIDNVCLSPIGKPCAMSELDQKLNNSLRGNRGRGRGGLLASPRAAVQTATRTKPAAGYGRNTFRSSSSSSSSELESSPSNDLRKKRKRRRASSRSKSKTSLSRSRSRSRSPTRFSPKKPAKKGRKDRAPVAERLNRGVAVKSKASIIKSVVEISEEKLSERAQRFAQPGSVAVKSQDYGVSYAGGRDFASACSEHVVGYSTSLEKQFLRLTSAPDPATIRPPHILEKSLKMVKDRWESGSKDYHYAWDQLKSIRQDLTVQGIRTMLTIEVYETHARLAILAKDHGEFNQCMSQLEQLYDADNFTKEDLSNKAEFLSYRLLYYIYTNSSIGINRLLARLSAEERQSLFLKHACAVRSAWTLGVFSKLFDLYSSAKRDPRLSHLKAMMDWFLPKTRNLALRAIIKAYRPDFPIAFVTSSLCFSSEEETRTFLGTVGVSFDKSGQNIDCKSSMKAVVSL
ncbi:unnamed protein product [Notodromas monacha]|uniref:SAC3/GANP/THP3 conserved domain-containing protein n=1 Tax=Notodromas monacha TaxID=399045 RepID=A0A7R9BGJ4_9CRUS|nr:unnamed protein product [Notodromas monacha]CAG0913711.1 unnamed protein product [Notodromas monacha]